MSFNPHPNKQAQEIIFRKKTKKINHPPQKIYRCYKNFVITNFSNTLKGGLEKVNDDSYKNFESIFLNALNI